MQTYSYQLSRTYDYYCWPIKRLKKKVKSFYFIYFKLRTEWIYKEPGVVTSKHGSSFSTYLHVLYSWFNLPLEPWKVSFKIKFTKIKPTTHQNRKLNDTLVSGRFLPNIMENKLQKASSIQWEPRVPLLNMLNQWLPQLTCQADVSSDKMA